MDPSNDNDPNVQIEILAAELGQSPDVWARWHNCDRRIDDDLTALGVRGFLQVGAFCGGGLMPSFQDSLDERDFLAGWHAHDVCGMDEPSGAVDWDPTRPLAEQWPWSSVRASAIPADAPESDDAVWNAMTEEQRADIHRLNASASDPAALLADVRECTPAELEAEQPPADVAAAVERIAEMADEPEAGKP